MTNNRLHKIIRTFMHINVLLVTTIILMSCTNPESTVDKSKLTPKDYRLFQNTEVWPLAKAAINRDYDEIRELVTCNPSLIDIKDSIYGNSILMFSIFHKDYTLFKIIMDHNPDINYYNNWQASPIFEASRYNDSEVKFVADLVDSGANVNDTIYNDDETKVMTTPVLEAASHGNSKIMNYLLDHGGKINIKSDFGDTPLGNAIITRHYDLAIELINKGAEYKGPIYYTVDKKGNPTIPTNILEALRCQTLDPFSRNYLKKMKIVNFLKKKGLDYDKEPVPEYIVKKIKTKYGIFWKLYLNNY